MMREREVPSVTELQAFFGVRLSEVFLCVSDLVRLFPPGVEFTRGEMVREFHASYQERTIDRALFLLEAHGALRCLRDKPLGGLHRGALYSLVDQTEWHEYDKAIAARRRERMPFIRLQHKQMIVTEYQSAIGRF